MSEEPAVEGNAREESPEYTFPEPNPQEAMFFFNIIKNVANLPDINWDNVATDSGFKNAAVAKVSLSRSCLCLGRRLTPLSSTQKRFYQIKQKLGLDSSLTGCGPIKHVRKPKASGSASTSETTQEVAISDPTRKPVASPRVNKRRRTVVKTEKQDHAHAPKDQLGSSPTKTGVKTEDENY